MNYSLSDQNSVPFSVDWSSRFYLNLLKYRVLIFGFILPYVCSYMLPLFKFIALVYWLVDREVIATFYQMYGASALGIN